MDTNPQIPAQDQTTPEMNQAGIPPQPVAPPPASNPTGSPVVPTSNSGSWKGVVALVLGILGIFTSGLLVVGMAIPVGAIVLGSMGLKTSRRGMAIAGIILGAIDLTLSIIILLFLGTILLFTNGAANLAKNLPASPSPSPSVSQFANTTYCYSVDTPIDYGVVTSGVNKSDTRMCHLSFVPTATDSHEQVNIYAPLSDYTSLEAEYAAAKAVKHTGGTATFEKVDIDGLPAYKSTIDYIAYKEYEYLLYNPKGYVLSNGKTVHAFSALFGRQASSDTATTTMDTFTWE